MKILLCEDEVSLAYAMKKVLEYNDYDVTLKFDGEQALKCLDNNVFDLVILDVLMPIKDGLEVLKEIRSNNNFVPVIILSALSEFEDKVKGLDYGANDYISKPFDFAELLARIRVLTREIVNDVFKCNDLILDKSSLELKSNNGCFCLSKKEFMMMEMLMSSKNHKIENSKFLEKIWGNEENLDESVVKIYIKYLEKKLHLLTDTVFIKGKDDVFYYLEIV